MSDKAVDINIESADDAKATDVADDAKSTDAADTMTEEPETGDIPEEEKSEEAGEEAGEADAEEKSEAGGSDESQEDGDARYLRLLAEFQNYKKRIEKEKSDLYSYANEKIMTELLEVMDNFERALEQPDGDGFKEGMGMIFDQLGNVLNKEGLAEIDALGLDFDPNVHNALMTEETDEYESGKVSAVMQKGYTLNGKVIRPSMVKVVE